MFLMLCKISINLVTLIVWLHICSLWPCLRRWTKNMWNVLKRKSFFTEVDLRRNFKLKKSAKLKLCFSFFLFAEILFCIFNLFSRSLITAKLCSFYFNLHNSVPNIQTNQKRMDGVPGIRTQDHKMEVTVLWALVTDCKPRFRYS